MQKTAVITGVTGQDGAFLSRFLLGHNYKIFGAARRSSCDNRERLRKFNILEHRDFSLVDCDVTDYRSVHSVLKLALDHNLKCNQHILPVEIYNLAAMSDVGISFNQPEVCFDVNTKGVLNILQEMTLHPKLFKLYQAGTSEQFGSNVDSDGFQRETTQFHPRSPYAVSKVAAHHLVQNYREAYGLHASVGILFNHCSELRGENFVTRKVSKYVGRFYNDLRLNKEFQKLYEPPPSKEGLLIKFQGSKLHLGNINSYRDWGYAQDYVRAMYLMVQQNKPDDYVISTGITHSVKDLLDHAFRIIDIKDWSPYVDFLPSLIRPSEVDYLRGDSSKAKDKLGWVPETTFEQLVQKMVESDAQI